MTQTGQLAMRFGHERAITRDEAWFDQACSWVWNLEPGTRFTSDELRDAIGNPEGTGNVVGSFFHHAEERGWIEPDGARKSRRSEARGRAIVIWRRR